MDIKIYMSKQRITKSLISQMQFPSLAVIKDGTALGFLLNVKKNQHKVILIEHKELFYVISAAYEKRTYSIICLCGKVTRTLRFTTTQHCDEWWEAYENMLNHAVYQIYI